MPSLRQLQALMLVGQTGSFTRAADRMAVTQSAVSILIRELESEMNTPLIHRGRAARLTESGERLERAARRATHEIEQAQREIREHRGVTQTVIRVAVGSMSAATFVPSAMARLESDSTTDIRVEVLDGPVGKLGDLLISGDADVGIGSIDSLIRRSAAFRTELLLSDTLCAVAAANSPYGALLKKRRFDWATLSSAPLILLGRQGGQWQQLLLKRMAENKQSYRAQEVQLFSTALAMVREGLGVAIVPNFAARYLGQGFNARSIGDAGERWSTYLVVRKEPTVPEVAMLALKSALNAAIHFE